MVFLLSKTTLTLLLPSLQDDNKGREKTVAHSSASKSTSSMYVFPLTTTTTSSIAALLPWATATITRPRCYLARQKICLAYWLEAILLSRAPEREKFFFLSFWCAWSPPTSKQGEFFWCAR